MKTIKIKRLALLNFKGARNETYDFDQTTIISGRNGLGKTTILDAFLWLLFNKNSNGSTTFGVKTYDENGNIIPHLTHMVTAFLDIDGEEVILRKTLTEKWVKPHGKTTEEFQGNETAYEVNNVPYKAKDYAAYINNIIPEESFRAATNPNFFPTLHWENQKQLLIRLVGGVTQEEIVNGTQTFARLLAEIQNKPIDLYRKEVVAAKNKLKAESESIEPRIDEVKRALPAKPNQELQEQEITHINEQIAAADNDIAAIEKEIASIDNSLADDSKRLDETNKVYNDLIHQKAELQNRLTELTATISREATTEYARLVSVRNIAIATRQTTEKEIRNLEYEAGNKRAEKEHQEQIRTDLRPKVLAIITEIDNIKAEVYDPESATCPTCHQVLPEDMQQDAERKFNDAKATRIKTKEQERDNLKANGVAAMNISNQLTIDIAAIESKIDETKKQLKEIPEEPKAPAVDYESDLRYIALQKDIAAIDTKIANAKPAETKDNSTLVLRKAELNEKKASYVQMKNLHAVRLNEINAANRSYDEQAARHDARIKELEEQLHDICQAIANLEQMEDLITAYKQREVTILENKVNNLFQMCRWRFYKPLVNGGQEETCECMVNGVPYADANRAAQLNAGIDIINALQKFNGFCPPIFIDNAEAINDILSTPAQVIALYVTTDNVLTFKTK